MSSRNKYKYYIVEIYRYTNKKPQVRSRTSVTAKMFYDTLRDTIYESVEKGDYIVHINDSVFVDKVSKSMYERAIHEFKKTGRRYYHIDNYIFERVPSYE